MSKFRIVLCMKLERVNKQKWCCLKRNNAPTGPWARIQSQLKSAFLFKPLKITGIFYFHSIVFHSVCDVSMPLQCIALSEKLNGFSPSSGECAESLKNEAWMEKMSRISFWYWIYSQHPEHWMAYAAGLKCNGYLKCRSRISLRSDVRDKVKTSVFVALATHEWTVNSK